MTISRKLLRKVIHEIAILFCGIGLVIVNFGMYLDYKLKDPDSDDPT